MLAALEQAIAPLVALRHERTTNVVDATRATVLALEALARDEGSSVADFYDGEAGAQLAGLLRELLATSSGLAFHPAEWPQILSAIIAGGSVKPAVGGDGRVFIWGVLEARLQSVDTLVLGGLNEGSWPRRAESDRFMSRLMKGGASPRTAERRIGQAAHDFQMAMGTPQLVLTRSARSGDAPAVASRWLQRLLAAAEGPHTVAMKTARHRSAGLGTWPRCSAEPGLRAAARAEATGDGPAEGVFSVTEIEDAAPRSLCGLCAANPPARSAGAASARSGRGRARHASSTDIIHEFSMQVPDPNADDAPERLLKIARRLFDAAALPPDIDAVWWPRFVDMAPRLVEWDRTRPPGIQARHAELSASRTEGVAINRRHLAWPRGPHRCPTGRR